MPVGGDLHPVLNNAQGALGPQSRRWQHTGQRLPVQEEPDELPAGMRRGSERQGEAQCVPRFLG